MKATMIRTYDFHAFPPRDGVDAFNLAQEQKRNLWTALRDIHASVAARRAALIAATKAAAPASAGRKTALTALFKSPEWLALSAERVDRFRAAKQAAAAAGLHWGSYNDLTAAFESAVKSAAANGGSPGPSFHGEAVTIQFSAPGGVPVAALFSGRNDASFSPSLPRPRKNQAETGSRRGRRPVFRLAFAVRTDRNNLGPAQLDMDVLLDRPLPPGGKVKMMHVRRTARPIIARDGSAHWRAGWRVAIVVETDAPKPRATGAAGVAMTWKAETDGEAVAAIVDDGTRVRKIVLPIGHAAAWEHVRELKAAASAAAATQEDRAAWIIATRHAERARLIHWREVAAGLAARYRVVAFQAMKAMAGTGAKNNSAPTLLTAEIIRAVENAGGETFAIAVAAPESRADVAKKLRRAAAKHLAALVSAKAASEKTAADQANVA